MYVFDCNRPSHCQNQDVSNVYLGGRLCANRQSKFVIEPQDIGSYYFRHCFAGRAHVEYFGTDEFGPMAISMIRETTEKKETKTGIVSQIIYRMIVRISDVRKNFFILSLISLKSQQIFD